MTEREAQAMAIRLTRIWGLVDIHSLGLIQSTGGWHFYCGGVVEASVYVSVEVDSHRGWEVAFAGPCGRLRWREDNPQLQWTRIHPVMNLLASAHPTFWGLVSAALSPSNWPGRWETKAQNFHGQWLPVFRRKCWLSGCNIEASMHEKAEWMQEFTKEEIKSWNLKM